MATSIKYIDSTGKKFYTSEPANYGPDGPQEIKLRGKYVIGGSAPHWNRHTDNNRSKTPDGPKFGLHNLPKKVFYIADAYNGHGVMITQADLFARTGVTIGFD